MTRVYYADYNSDTTGNTPAGWERNDTTNFLPVISTSNAFEGTKCVQLTKLSTAPTSSHWFAIDTVTSPGTGEYEVKATVYFIDATLRGGPVFRGKDATTNEGYFMALRAGNSFRFSYLSGTTETVKVTATVSYSAATHYYIKAYASGSTIRGRFWAASGSEPSTWDIDTTDATLNNTNHLVGAYYFNGSADTDSIFFDVLEANDFNSAAAVVTTKPRLLLMKVG